MCVFKKNSRDDYNILWATIPWSNPECSDFFFSEDGYKYYSKSKSLKIKVLILFVKWLTTNFNMNIICENIHEYIQVFKYLLQGYTK